MFRILFLLLFLGLSAGCAFAQFNKADLVNFTQKDGLPSNEAYCVIRDSRNFIWIATDQGVVRFNGSKMEKFELPDNVVFKIREDEKGRIWFFSHSGKLAYFEDEKVWPYRYNDSIARNSSGLLITEAYVTASDEILLNAILNYNYKILKNGRVLHVMEDIPATISMNITEMRPGKLFTQKTTFTYFPNVTRLVINRKDRWPHTYTIPLKENKAYTHYSSLYGKDGTIYMFLGPLLFKLDRDGSFSSCELPGHILSLYRDSLTGHLFAGLMNEGICMLDSSLNNVRHILLFKGKTVTSICADFEGDIWFTTLENGVYYSKSQNIFRKNFSSIIDQGPVLRMFNYQNKFLLVANAGELSLLNGNKKESLLKYPVTDISDIFMRQNGQLFFLGHFNFRNRFHNTRSEIPGLRKIFTVRVGHETLFLNDSIRFINASNTIVGINLQKAVVEKMEWQESAIHYPYTSFNIQSACVKDSANIFLGAMGNLYVLSLPDSAIHPYAYGNGLFKNGVTYMQKMHAGIFAFGIRFGGIALMRDTAVIARITEAEGLISNSIKYILPVGDRLWVATPKGLSAIQFSSYNPVRYTIRNFGESSGMSDQVIYQLISFRDNIFAATSKGMYEISNTETLMGEKYPLIPLYITSVSYYKGDTSSIASITVPYNDSRVSVAFSAVCFNAPKQLRYLYRFRNRDSTWYSINSPELILQNLSPGSYELEIKAEMPEQNRVSSVETLRITVTKPWWQWIWLWGIVAALVFLGFLLFYKRRIRQVEKREAEKTALRMQVANLEQTALRSQMNPHFIFNCLTSIQQLVVTGNKEEANEYLVKFARLIRKTLEYSGRSYISVEEEVNYLQEYIVLEQLRIPGKFEFSIQVDDAIDRNKMQIPNMMLQPIVENSIRHGIKHLEKAGALINIEIRKKGPYLSFEVTDNGIGRKASGRSGNDLFAGEKSFGMDIVRKRLEAIEGNEKNGAQLIVEDLYGTDGAAAGTRVTIIMPYKEWSYDKSDSY